MMITVGCDPEVFLKNKDGINIPAIGLVGGTKLDPLPVDGGALQEDNVMAELNITPARTTMEFITNLSKVTGALKGTIAKHGLIISSETVVTFPNKFLAHPQARAFGCEPDINAWTMDFNPPPVEDVSKFKTRMAGGHIHIAMMSKKKCYLDQKPSRRFDFARYCDIAIGLGMTLLEGPPAAKRRNWYGRAGSFRNKPYGIEYRVPANNWFLSQAGQQYAFHLAYNAAERYTLEGNDLEEGLLKTLLMDDAYRRELINTIDSVDRKNAIAMLKDLGLYSPVAHKTISPSELENSKIA